MTASLASRQEALVEALLSRLGLIRPEHHEGLPWEAFRKLHKKISLSFDVDWTTLSLPMCRLLFGLALFQQPRNLLVLGNHVGFASAWLLRDPDDPACGAPVERFDGVDPDLAANRRARGNCERLGFGSAATIWDETGQRHLARRRDPIDMVLIDIDDPETGKQDYAELLTCSLPMLRTGALILGHDSMVPRFEAAMDRFHILIDQSADLDGPWVLPVDDCGLTVARRRADD